MIYLEIFSSNPKYEALLVTGILLLYFLMLTIIGWFTSGKSDNDTFFRGNRSSPWFLVAFGMIGASLSGVTFLSVPGAVGKEGFSYIQVVLGYLLGYLVIIQVLLPLYYSLNLTTIYTYLHKRFGRSSYKTGAFYFLLSRSIGSSFRLFLVAMVFQAFVSDHLGVPFELTVFFTILLIWLYSFKGGIKTIVYTDTLQTFFMLLALGITLVYVWNQLESMGINPIEKLSASKYSEWFVWEKGAKNHFLKHFFGGMFITIVMTGLDQDMMQKNLTCRNLKDAQKNMFWMSLSLVPVNLLFLSMGALLYIYGIESGFLTEFFQNSEMMSEGKHLGFTMPSGEMEYIKTDQMFPYTASNYLPGIAGLFFFIGLVSAAYSSADSALTSMTTSFCIDFLNFDENNGNKKTRQLVHVGVSVFLFLQILLFKAINNDAVINELFTIAGYTYGPLLGLFAFGLFTKLAVKDKWVPIVCVISPMLCFILNKYSESLFDGYKFGFELLILNGMLTFTGLFLLRKNTKY